jgi:predicted acylesterase/phospholipase RssA
METNQPLSASADGLNQGWCLVLSGGGTKGVYHWGVWKGLKELGIGVKAMMGTSIGALGAALLAQGAEDSLEVLVGSLGLDSLVSLPSDLMRDGRPQLDRATLPAARALVRTVLEKRGLDTAPLRAFLTEHVNEAAIRASGVDLGVVTVNLTDLSPLRVFLDQMEPGRLVDYLMASAAFPGFESPVINGKRYVDGGLYDNIPYAMARARGYRKLIVSDVSGVGLNRKPRVEGTVTAYIRNSIKMGGPFEFDPGFLEQFRALGYLDTLRTFGRLEGGSYFLVPDSGPPEPGLEAAAQVFEVDRVQAYRRDELARLVRSQRDKAEARLADLLGTSGRAALAARLLKDGGLSAFQGGAYQTWRLIEELFPGPGGQALRKSLSRLTPQLASALHYLRHQKD